MQCHIVDTFADDTFAGNPAGVVLVGPLPDEITMQRLAHAVGMPTTAFVAPVAPGEYRVRWFTPHKEVNLCGHATIGSARHLFAQPENMGRRRLRFVSDNGVLNAERVGSCIAIDLAAVEVRSIDPPAGLLAALGMPAAVSCAVSNDDVLVELTSAAAVAAVRPDFPALARQPFRGHIITARGDAEFDVASRTFFPALGVDEDQVCVSAHAKLGPFWARRLGRDRFTAVQLSERGGRLAVSVTGDRVRVLAAAVPRGCLDIEEVCL